MTEDEAVQWIRAHVDVSRETLLVRFADLLIERSATQNLVSATTLSTIWARHIVDAAQLTLHAPSNGSWLDIGSGAGLPGIVIAAMRDDPMQLVEPRRLRTEFLNEAVATLGLDNVDVVTDRIERTHGVVDVITARAVASLDALFCMAAHRASRSTVWILPKGRNAHHEVEAARHAWQGSFEVKPSITAPDSLIVIAQEVRPR